jgi:ech hydrogenase subunit B
MRINSCDIVWSGFPVRMTLIILGYIFLAPLVGGILAGLDRKVSARMQGRVGPPILQPFYDVLKLFKKENIVVRRSQNFYIFYFFIFVIFTGALFFTGSDILLLVFSLTLAGIFFVLAAYKASSPYSFIGAERELIQMMSYEPAVLFCCIGMYMVTGSFYIRDIASFDKPLIIYLPGLFAAYLYILAIKFRKSPFDLSSSHHAHQELVRGITTEFSGRTLGLIEIAHWYENVFILGIVYLFFASMPIVAVLITLFIFFAMTFIDNVFARAKWEITLLSSWVIAIILGLGNIIILFFVVK